MVRALGTDSMKYWNKLVEDINGMSRQEPPTLGDKLLSNMKAAAVGANIRVVIQQPTAYLRAAAMIDPKPYQRFGNEVRYRANEPICADCRLEGFGLF